MNLAKRALAFVGDLSREIMGFSGVAVFSYGAWLAWHPAGFMVGGTLLIVGAVMLGKGAK